MNYKKDRIGWIAAAYRNPLLCPVYVDRLQSLDPFRSHDLPKSGNDPCGFGTASRSHPAFGKSLGRSK